MLKILNLIPVNQERQHLTFSKQYLIWKRYIVGFIIQYILLKDSCQHGQHLKISGNILRYTSKILLSLPQQLLCSFQKEWFYRTFNLLQNFKRIHMFRVRRSKFTNLHFNFQKFTFFVISQKLNAWMGTCPCVTFTFDYTIFRCIS